MAFRFFTHLTFNMEVKVSCSQWFTLKASFTTQLTGITTKWALQTVSTDKSTGIRANQGHCVQFDPHIDFITNPDEPTPLRCEYQTQIKVVTDTQNVTNDPSTID